MGSCKLNRILDGSTLAAACLVLAACGGTDSNQQGGPVIGDPNQPMAGTMGAVAGATATAGATGVGPDQTAGTGTAGAGAAGTGVAGTGVAGTDAAGTGAGGMDAAGTGAGGMEATGGMGAGGMEATGGMGAPAGVCDTSGFLSECIQGGAQWGTEQQSGPCTSGTTIYGVTEQLGPYGVRQEYNVGADFNTGNTKAGDFGTCENFINSFGADPKGSMDLKMTHDLDFGLYTVFYPGCMPDGEKFPLITWGNGTCAMPEGYGPLLRYVASFGYIVVAANSVQTGSGSQMRKALDFMLAENDKADSKYYQKIDTDKIGAMGHSQGSMGTVAASSDPRIKAVILWNGGTSASKPYLAVSGDSDLFTSVSSYRNAVMAAPRPAAWMFYHQIPTSVNGSTTGTLAPGHLTLMMEPERVNKMAVAWWDMMLKGKEEAKKMFIGADCTLCDPQAVKSMWAPPAVFGSATDKSHEYGANSMLQ